jgi:hypothetical protein
MIHRQKCVPRVFADFCLIGNSSEFPMRQNAPLRCAARRWEDRFAILLARLSSAALTGRMRGWGSRSPLADFVLTYLPRKSQAGYENLYLNNMIFHEKITKNIEIVQLIWIVVVKLIA